MIPNEPASNGFTEYQMCCPDNPPEVFPKRFAQTTAWSPGSVELQVTGEPRTSWQLVTDLPYDVNRHVSTGIGPGAYKLGLATWTKTSGWSGAITRYLNLKGETIWKPAEPKQTATYEFTLEISDQDATAIKAFEMEHIDDFAYAWDCSFGTMRHLLSQLSETGKREAIRQLVNQLITANAGYLIPAGPDDLAAWGPRVRLVYNLLCDQSANRDYRNEHTPVRRRFEVADNQITMRVDTGPLHPGSAEYLKTDGIPSAFSAGSYEEYLQHTEQPAQQKPEAETLTPVAGPPAVNTMVVWSVDTTQLRLDAPRGGLEPDEMFIYAAPDTSEKSAKDEDSIIGILKYSHGKIVAHDGPYAWVKVSLVEEPADPDDPDDHGSRSETGAKLSADEGYVRVRGSLLTDKKT